MPGFQNQVGAAQAPAFAGDFASSNPRKAVVAGAGGLVAGANGVTVGRFAWLSAERTDQDNAPSVVNNFGSGPVSGFVHRHQQALITTYLTESGMVIPAGFAMGLMATGDFWVKNEGSTQALFGHKVYADLGTGAARFGVTGAPLTASGSASTIAAGTASTTGTITNGTTLTLSAVASGTVYPGAAISGTGVISGTRIVSQITPLLAGEALGGVGRYVVSIQHDTNVASTTISMTHGVLTVGGTVSGTFKVGGIVSGSGVTAGTRITALGSGTGGAGTYIVDTTQTVVSTAISATMDVETSWVAMSSGNAGELVKITHGALG